MSVATLLKKETDGSLFKKKVGYLQPDQSTVHYREGDSPDMTGLPAQLARKKGEGPTRDEQGPFKPIAEHRQDFQSTPTVGAFAAADGLQDMGKIARGLEALGDMSRSWEGPSVDEPSSGNRHRYGSGGLVEAPSAETTAQDDHLKGPFRLSLGEISGAMNQDDPHAMKEASSQKVAQAFIDECTRIGEANGGIMPWRPDIHDFSEWVEKHAETPEVSRDQAQEALERLNALHATKPTAGQLARSGALGAVVGPIASNVSKLVSSGHFHTPREMAGQVAGGLVFGTAMPLAKHHVESGAEQRVLKNYINQGHHGRLASEIEGRLGSPV